MTTPGRYSGKTPERRRTAIDTTEVRVAGTPTEVSRAVGRIAHVVDVVKQSRQIPQRDHPGRVTVYLRVRADG